MFLFVILSVSYSCQTDVLLRLCQMYFSKPERTKSDGGEVDLGETCPHGVCGNTLNVTNVANPVRSARDANRIAKRHQRNLVCLGDTTSVEKTWDETGFVRIDFYHFLKIQSF